MANQRILRLKVHNVKGIRELDVVPGENALVIIGGKNGAGKSTALDSIVYALGGKKALPREPIRKGEERAEIVVELDELIVTRTMTPKTDKLLVASRDGAPFSSPQAMLDKLVGRLSFDPLAFARLGETAGGRREQAEIVMEMAGLDFADLDRKREETFNERTVENRRASDLKAQLAALPKYDDVPEVETQAGEIINELKAAREHNQQIEDAEDGALDARAVTGAIAEEITDLEQRLEVLKKNFEAKKATAISLGRDVAELGDRIDEGPIAAKLERLEEDNRRARANILRATTASDLKKAEADAEGLTEHLGRIDTAKKKRIREAKLPVPGLGFDTEGLTLNGLPFVQISGSEKLRCSVAMGMAMNPELRVMLIDQGSELDGDNLELLREMAVEAGAQIWMARVSEGEECTIIMEDGSTKGVDDGEAN